MFGVKDDIGSNELKTLFNDNAGIETVVMRKHQVPLEPSVESKEQCRLNGGAKNTVS